MREMGRYSFAGRSLRLAFVAVVATVSGWMGACADSHSHATLSQGCVINTDCNEPLVCAFQRCHNACETSRDCDAGQRCVASDRPFHVCQLADESHCEANSYCPIGQVCGVDSQCRDGCTTSRDCLSGQVCVSATCAEPSELDSSGALVSSASDASTAPSGLPCSFNSDCPSPLLCRSGTCSEECRTTGDCPTGLACDNSRCVVPLACSLGDAGSDPRAGAPCLYSSQCPAPLACVHGFCSCECLGTTDCAAGFACVKNRCQPSIAGANAVQIGPQGGTVTSGDGNLTMQIPAGAIEGSVVFAVRAATAWPSGAVGIVYEVEPSGTRFAKPATIALSYAGADLGKATPSELFVGTAVGASWQSLGTAVNDPSAQTVASTTTHLSVFGLVLFSGPASTRDAGVDIAQGGNDGRGGTIGAAGTSTAGTVSTAGRSPNGGAAQGGSGIGGGVAVGGLPGFGGLPGLGGRTGTAGLPGSGGAGGAGGLGGKDAGTCATCTCSGQVDCDAGSSCCFVAQQQMSACQTAAACKAIGGTILP
jgi:hypothetical protein